MKATCVRGKHSARRKKLNKKKLVCFIFLFIVFTFFVIEILKNDELQEIDNQDMQYFENFEDESSNVMQNELNTVTIDMPDAIKNYKVIGELVIEKIDFDKYILNKTTDSSLNLSVTKLYGPEVNRPGNLCIIGHNSKGLFIKLKKLVVGDRFYVIDKDTCEKVTYEIYDKYTVIPTDLRCLNQDTNEKREVTLITCNPRRVN